MNDRPKELLRSTTYDALKTMIVTGQLAPGARVTEIDLCEKLGVSRTPVREALNRLERDGLVVGRPRNGYAIMSFDAKLLQEAFELREVLEAFAATLAIARLTEADRAGLRAMIAECDRLATLPDRDSRHSFAELQIGIDLHRTIAELSGNTVLCDVLNSILDKCQIYVWMELTRLNDWEDARQEHRLIVEAICTGDVPAATASLQQHIRQSRLNILELLRMRNDLHSFYAHQTSGKG